MTVLNENMGQIKMTKINRITHYDENGDLPNFGVAPFDGGSYLLRLPCGEWASGYLFENWESGDHPLDRGFEFYEWVILDDEKTYDYESISHWTELPDWDVYYNSPDNQEVNELLDKLPTHNFGLDSFIYTEDEFFHPND